MAANAFLPPGFDKQKALTLMRERDLDGILLTSPENVFYATGFTTLPSSGNPILYSLRSRLPFFVFVNAEGKTTLCCWGYATMGVSFGADEIRGFGDYGVALKTLEALLREKLAPLARLGIESTCPHYVSTIIDDAGYAAGIVVVDDLLAALRLVKSPREIALIQKSTEIIEQTVAELYDVIRLGMSRVDLMREAKYRMIRNGAMGISHVTFGFGTANPEVEIDERFDQGRIATLDLGAIYHGYCSDNRRYVCAGPVPQALQEQYAKMVAIVDGVGAALVPGRSYAEVYQRGVDLYGEYTVELLRQLTKVGHNIGLETEEQWIDNDATSVVQENMVINVELYSRAPTGHYIGDEETFVVGASGAQRISVLPREIRSIAS